MKNQIRSIIIIFLAAVITIGIIGSDLAAQSFQPIASYLGTFERERIGYWLSQAGDVNGDGYDDFICGNYHTPAMGYDGGAVYLILGRSSDSWSLNNSMNQADATFYGESKYEAVGYHCGGGGDVNGDGLDDILIGAPAGNESGKDRPGSAYLILGRRNADWGNNCIAAQNADVKFDGEVDYDQAGKAVAIAGDLNNDGYDDMIIGAPYYDNLIQDGGKVYIVLGQSSGWNFNEKLGTNSSGSYRCDLESAKAGYMVSGAGDVNGDGCDDFLVGAPGKGRVYLIFGRSNASWGHNRSLDEADVIFVAENRNENLGWIVASAGDVNHDGKDDILFSTPYSGQSGQEAGKTYLVFGRSSWPYEFDLDDVDASFLGEAAFDNSGWTAAGIKDINDDGFDDFMIGAWYNDNTGEDAGKAYVIYGKRDGWFQNQNLSTIPDFIEGETEIDYMGFSVAPAGDANNDDLADFIVSAPYRNEAFLWGGEIFLFLGERPKYPIFGSAYFGDTDRPVDGVVMTFDGTSSGSGETDDSGNYNILIPDGRNITMKPAKAKESDQGGNTIISYDAALIARQVVGLENFAEWQLLAGDVDQDGALTAYDAALIARYRVMLPELPESHVSEWIFNPQEKNYTDISDTLRNENYKAMILGEVHGGWHDDTGLAKAPILNLLSDLPMQTASQQLISIPVKVPPEMEVLSLDLEIEYNPQSFIFKNIEKQAEIQGFQVSHSDENGKLRIGFYGTEARKMSNAPLIIHFGLANNSASEAEIKINYVIVNTTRFAGEQTSITTISQNDLPESFLLQQNYPNPFNPVTTIQYALPDAENVVIKIYNLMGEEIRTLVDDFKPAGIYRITWNGKDSNGQEVASGIYFYKAICGDKTQLRRMVKMK